MLTASAQRSEEIRLVFLGIKQQTAAGAVRLAGGGEAARTLVGLLDVVAQALEEATGAGRRGHNRRAPWSLNRRARADSSVRIRACAGRA